MAVEKKMLLTIDSNTGDVQKDLKGVSDDLKDVGKQAGEVGTKGKRGFGLLGRGLNAGKAGFNALGTAIKATGIGLLVGILVKLGAELMKNDKVARIVEKTFAAIGAVVGVLVDVVVSVGEALFTAFNSPQTAIDFINEKIGTVYSIISGVAKLIKESFILTLQTMKAALIQAGIAAAEFFTAGLADTSGMQKALDETKKAINETKKEISEAAGQVAGPFVSAFKSAKKFVGDLTQEMTAQARLAIKLADAQRKLRDNIREVELATAMARSEIAKMKMDSDNINKSIEERIKAATAAAQKEENLRAARQKNIEDGIRLVKAEMRIQGEAGKDNEELQQKLNDLKIEFYAIEEEGLALQTEMQNKILGLQKEQVDAEAAFFATNRERRRQFLDEQQQEIEAITEHYNQQLLIAEKYGLDTADLLETQEKELKAIKDKYDAIEDAANEAKNKKEIDDAHAVRDAKIKMSQDVVGALIALNNAFSKDDEASAKKQFERNKKLSIAMAAINTGQAVVNALTAGGNPVKLATGAQFVEAGIALAMGVAQIASIKKTKFQGGGDTGGNDGGGGGNFPTGITDTGGTTGGEGTGGMLDLGFLGGGDTGTLQAFVVSNEVTNSQQTEQLINDQASLVA
tara:strand:+ start:32 stop:1921 length:1890 start_codon:yes stop_codon:yes gene_type:complete